MSRGINKVILIATPNHGVSGNVANYCSVVGSSLECNDLKSDSLFINKLSINSVSRAKIPG